MDTSQPKPFVDRRLLVLEAKDLRITLNPKQIPLGKRGGRGYVLTRHNGPFKLTHINIQLLPEQEMFLTCKGCQTRLIIKGRGKMESIPNFCPNCVK